MSFEVLKAFGTYVEKSIVADVLHARKHRGIEFASSSVAAEGEGYRIEGELTLHGVTRPIRAKVKLSGGRWSTPRSARRRQELRIARRPDGGFGAERGIGSRRADCHGQVVQPPAARSARCVNTSAG